jgi:hypothetical protein
MGEKKKKKIKEEEVHNSPNKKIYKLNKITKNEYLHGVFILKIA